MRKKRREPTRAELDRARAQMAPLLAELDRATAPASQAIDRMLALMGRAMAPLLRVMARFRSDSNKKLDRLYLAHARHGDTPEAAQYLLGRLADHLETGEPVREEAKVWLAAALRSINEGADANKSLGLKSGKGQRPRRIDHNNTRLRDPLLAMEVQRLVNEGMQPTRNPTTTRRESACSIVANDYGLEEKYIEKVYYHHRKMSD